MIGRKVELRRADVPGSYRGVGQGVELTLRVDVGPDGQDIVSGDLAFQNAPGRFAHHHSFQSTALVVEEREDGQMLRGPVKVHRADMLDIARLDLTIPDEGEPIATYQFYRLGAGGREEAARFTFVLERVSAYFRRVELEIDRVVGVPLPEPLPACDLPEGPADLGRRRIGFEDAFREAGIDLAVRIGDEIALDAAGPDGLWTDEEMHAAMEAHFSTYAETAQWQLYLLLATRYVSPGVLGIMFDSGDEFPRQGAAVFYHHPLLSHPNIPEIERRREYQFTIVHELGHAFNLLHSFQKGIFSTHGIMPRPASLSWMNYPHLFPFGYAYPDGWQGDHSFWSQFRYGFDTDEIAHLRHNDALAVMMGGHEFGFAGHREERPFDVPSSEADVSLTLWLPDTVEFLEQVEGDVRLRNESATPLGTPASLHPGADALEILVKRPNARVPERHGSLATVCVRAAREELPPGEAVYQELTLGYGRRRWVVDEPGTYEVQAVLRLPDGRRLASQLRRVRVLMPENREADRAAADVFTREAGSWLALEGSRADRFAAIRDRLQDIRGRLAKSAFGRQLEVVDGLMNTRVFKDVEHKRIIRPDRSKAAELLAKALGADLGRGRLQPREGASHLRLGRQLRTAALAFARDGREDRAKAVLRTNERFLQRIEAPAPALAEHARFADEVEAEAEAAAT